MSEENIPDGRDGRPNLTAHVSFPSEADTIREALAAADEYARHLQADITALERRAEQAEAERDALVGIIRKADMPRDGAAGRALLADLRLAATTPGEPQHTHDENGTPVDCMACFMEATTPGEPRREQAMSEADTTKGENMDDTKLRYVYFDVVGPGLFQLTDQDGLCIETEDDTVLAAAMAAVVPR